MYKIDKTSGDIIFPDGFILPCPYEDPRYMEYAEWVKAGNEPELIEEPLPTA